MLALSFWTIFCSLKSIVERKLSSFGIQILSSIQKTCEPKAIVDDAVERSAANDIFLTKVASTSPKLTPRP